MALTSVAGCRLFARPGDGVSPTGPDEEPPTVVFMQEMIDPSIGGFVSITFTDNQGLNLASLEQNKYIFRDSSGKEIWGFTDNFPKINNDLRQAWVILPIPKRDDIAGLVYTLAISDPIVDIAGNQMQAGVLRTPENQELTVTFAGLNTAIRATVTDAILLASRSGQGMHAQLEVVLTADSDKVIAVRTVASELFTLKESLPNGSEGGSEGGTNGVSESSGAMTLSTVDDTQTLRVTLTFADAALTPEEHYQLHIAPGIETTTGETLVSNHLETQISVRLHPQTTAVSVREAQSDATGAGFWIRVAGDDHRDLRYFSPTELNTALGKVFAVSAGERFSGTWLLRLNQSVDSDSTHDWLVGDSEADPEVTTGTNNTQTRQDAGTVTVRLSTGGVATIIGAKNRHFLGSHIQDIGDINGDGHADWGMRAGNDGYVIFGGQSWLQAGGQLDLAALTQTQGSKILPMSTSLAQFVFAPLGDVNHDGIDDWAIADPVATKAGSQDIAGAVYVLYGKTTLGADISLETLSTDAGLTLYGAFASGLQERFARVLTNIGDFNNDGVSDLAIGRSTGQSVAIMFPAQLNAAHHMQTEAELAQANGAVLLLTSHVNIGMAAAGVGDVNGDGYADVVVGAPMYAQARGAAILIYGSGQWQAGEVAVHDASGTFVLTPDQGMMIHGTGLGSQLGAHVAAAGDVNGDGYADVLLAGANASGFLLYGSANGLTYLDIKDGEEDNHVDLSAFVFT